MKRLLQTAIVLGLSSWAFAAPPLYKLTVKLAPKGAYIVILNCGAPNGGSCTRQAPGGTYQLKPGTYRYTAGVAGQRSADYDALPGTLSIPKNKNMSFSLSPAARDLELYDYTCSAEYGYSKITGRVMNLTLRTLSLVQVAGSFYDERGAVLESSSSYLTVTSLKPYDSSSFTVMEALEDFATCRVTFETDEGTLSTRRRP